MRWSGRLRTLFRLIWFRLRFAWHWLAAALSGNVLGREAAVNALMRADWDERARSDAMYWIATKEGGAWSTEEFFRSGEADVAQILERARVELRPGDAVLDIGCGVGRLLRAMVRRGASGHGVDVSAEMIERAKANLGPDVKLTATPAHELGALPRGHFRLVYSYVVLQHIPEAAMILSCLAQCVGLLQEGGVLQMQLRNDHQFQATYDTYRGASVPVADVRRTLEAAGLSEITFEGEGTMYMWVRGVRQAMRT